MPKHQFGIIEAIKQDKDYSVYEPKKYNSISIDDDIVEVFCEKLNEMGTYFHELKRPEFGLAYCGVTLIPPSSLSFLREVILNEQQCNGSKDLRKLLLLIDKAIKEKKYIIHFGI